MAPISDRDLFDFLERTADAAFTVTDAGEICSWNSSAEVLFGFGRDEVIGKTCFELFRGRGALGTRVCTEHCQVRDCAAHHRPIPDFDLEVKARSGRRIWVNVSTMVHEDPKMGRRRIVYVMRSGADNATIEARTSSASESLRRPEPSGHRARSADQSPDAPQSPSSHQSEAI